MRTAVLASVLSALLALAPAAAADTWKGKTRQGRGVVVRTDEDGVVDRVRIAWRARCENGRYASRTLFLPPLDEAGTDAFEDTGVYWADLDDGYRARNTVRVTGTLGSDGRWTGVFRVRTVVRRNGRRIDSCRLRRLRWSAEPVESGRGRGRRGVPRRTSRL